MTALHAMLTSTVAGWRHIKAPPGAWMVEAFLLRVGVPCQTQALPAKYAKMQAQACFANTAHLVRHRRNLRYCEGFAARDNFPIPILHAWAIDADNRVVDPTLKEPERYEYLGYPIPLGVRRRWISRISQSVFDTGMGVNFKFMLKECPSLNDLIDDQYRGFIARKIAERGDRL